MDMDIVLSSVARPPTDLDFMEEESIARPPFELEEARAIPRPPSDIGARPAEPHTDSEIEALFQGLRYFIVWYDQTYPYGEYAGYQDYLAKLLVGVPMKIENNYTQAVRQLNTSYKNTKYILVVTGCKKKQLIQEIHNNAAVFRIYIIKPFIEKVMRWGSKLSKVVGVRHFNTLLQDIKGLTQTYRSANYQYPLCEQLLNYSVNPDPMLMSEQVVAALKDELSQEVDQLRFSCHYSIVIQIMREYFTRRLDRYNDCKDLALLDSPLVPLCELQGERPNDERRLQLSTGWNKLLQLASYFDECTYIVSGVDLSQLVGSQAKVSTLLSTASRLADVLTANGTIHETEHASTLADLHKCLYEHVIFYAGQQYGAVDKWSQLYLLRMLLLDIDCCLKIFLHFVLRASSSFADFHPEFIHAAVVSDMRISALIDLWDAWRAQDIPKNIALPDSELKSALEAIAIKKVVVLNTSGLLKGVQGAFKREFTTWEYSILRDFFIDVPTLAKLQYNFCYIVIEPSLTPAEYNQVIGACIARAITPLFILYMPSHSSARLAKSMFKSRWTVSLVYCRTFEQIAEYAENVESNLNRDLFQYSKYCDDFKATLEQVQGSGPRESHLSSDSKAEADAGWEVLTSVKNEIFEQLVEELSLGAKLIGSLHYYVLSDMRQQKQSATYWENYAALFGISNKYTSILDVNCSKNSLRAYTLQTTPPFYKMLNDAFRGGNTKAMARYRAFFSMLHDVVKKGILKKHIGFVFRGTYFNPQLIESLKPGTRVFSSCFTSTSKSEVVAREFARKTRRNVLLEIELDPHAHSNVDIHAEKCSLFPQEEEVLLLPFASFEIQRVFREDNLTLLSLKEIVPEFETVNLKGIEYCN